MVPDDVDLDDDNDGIRDTVECPAPTLAAKDFWVMFNPNFDAMGRRELYVTGAPGTEVAIGSFPRQTIPTRGSFSFDIGLTTIPSAGLIEAGRAMPIAATAPVQVFANNYRTGSVDAFSVVPERLLGTEYYAIGYPNSFAAESQISVYAVADGTSVTIGNAPPITLNRGESFLRETVGDATGTRIRATKPIAVNAGDRCLSTGMASCDHVEQMLLPVTSWAKSFFVPTLPQDQLYRVIASANATRVTVNGVTVATLNAGTFFQGTGGGVLVETNQPAQVYMVALGEASGVGDPSFILVPGAENAIPQVALSVLDAAYSNTLAISMPTAATGTLLLDGLPISATWTRYALTDFSYAQIAVAAGSHTLAAGAPFLPLVWGERTNESYGYMAGYAERPGRCTVDSDGDGIVDTFDLDSDGDNIYDVDEANGTDDDRDGRADGAPGPTGIATSAGDGLPALDTDGDGTPDRLDNDSDGDGISDPDEAGDADPRTRPVDTDSDGTPDFQDPDSDNDQRLDGEDNCRLIPNPDQRDADGDGMGDVCDLDDDGDGFADVYGVTGGGCAAGGNGAGSGALLLLGAVLGAVLGRRRRTVRAARIAAGAVMIAAGAAGTASAQVVIEAQNFPAERLRLGTDRSAILDVETGSIPRAHSWDLGMWLGVTNDPLTVYMDDGSGAQRAGSLVGNRIGGELMGAYTPLPWLHIGAALPLTVSQSRANDITGMPGSLPSLQSYGVGDLRVSPKVRLLRGPVDLAVIPELTLPTGRSEAYLGERTISFVPTLAASRHFGRMRVAADIGWRMREQARVANTVIDDELFARVGAGVRVMRSLELAASLGGATAAASPFADRRNQLELIGGPSLQLPSGLLMFAAAGAGANVGYSTPDWRALVGLRLGRLSEQKEQKEQEKVDPDPDRDGILGAADRCPMDPEDRDGFEDSDGCPDLDNDGDGIADAKDRCPLEPETVNGFEDTDGCPDQWPDPDGDGIVGDADRCPDRAEDFDGFEDGDGCPDEDNDGDRIADSLDRCPNQAGPIENRGCPDTDGDGDGIIDRLDNCPAEKGTAANNGCKKKELVSLTATGIKLSQRVFFDTDKAAIQKRSYKLLDNVARVIVAHPEIPLIEIEGHTDDVGTDEYNLDLSQRRADSVRAYLIRKNVEPERLTAAGFGEGRPLVSNSSSANRSMNRRVEFRINGDLKPLTASPGASPSPSTDTGAAPARPVR